MGWGGVGEGGGVLVTHLLPEVKIPALLMLGFIPYMSQLPGWLKCYKSGVGVGEGGGVLVTHLLPEVTGSSSPDVGLHSLHVSAAWLA